MTAATANVTGQKYVATAAPTPASAGPMAAILHAARGGREDADEDRCVLSTLRWARWAELGTPNYRLGTLLEHIQSEIRVWPLHGTLIGAQGVVDLVRFLLKRSYADPSHAGVKDILAFRADRMHALSRRVSAEWERRTKPAFAPTR